MTTQNEKTVLTLIKDSGFWSPDFAKINRASGIPKSTVRDIFHRFKPVIGVKVRVPLINTTGDKE